MRRLIALLAALALAFTACGDDTTDGADTGDETTTTTTTPPADDGTDGEAITTTTTAAPATTTPRPAIPTPEASDMAGLLAIDRPLVIGHAGGDQAWPHSTMFAFTEAAVGGADVLEMDVQLTGDGVLVVQHDDTVDRTTETTGRVRDLTYDELQALDNGYWWSSDWSNHDLPDEAYVYRGVRTGEVEPPAGYTADDFRVETFGSIAETFPDHVLDIEIKIPDGDDGDDDMAFAIEGARVLADEIEELGRTDSVVVVSFNDEMMAAFRDLAPNVTTSPGTTATFSWLVGSAELAPTDRVLQLPPFFDGIALLTDELLTKAAAEGVEIWAWPDDADTQENADFYEELVVDIGVDGVIAGHPTIAVTRFATLD